MPLPVEVQRLVERFKLHRDEYLTGNYNETQLRREFIDPMFKALGWDIDNEQGNAEAYKDVIHEDAIKIGGQTKAPDYCFRIGGARKFFLEAKKPAENIATDPNHAFQLRRYAWSAKLQLSILTDFEEFAVYDCRVKPEKTHKASMARIEFFRYEEYAERWDWIASKFSRDAILKGSFDKYAESSKTKHGTTEVDDAFLTEMEKWRFALAKNLANRNQDLDQRSLNFAVQRIIDRIVFLRIAEDRGIEDYGQLQMLQNGTKSYMRLTEQFRAADDRYNSGLFHFVPEKGRHEAPDDLTLSLKVDDDEVKGIIRGLYYPDSPYEFSFLPSDILGQIYERFLGKVIRLTAGHHAKVEEKPEVRIAGGVFYTPTFIVDYIVKETVGRLLDGKTPKQVAKIKIVDPSCGSGSFLIGAYQFILDWHRDWYVRNGAENYPKDINRVATGWRLTTAKRKEILLNNIFGVDIDSQAVEVTKLSLLLKVLDGENRETIARQKKLFHERALPDLGDNIKCGNSLIGPDVYDNQQLNLFDPEEQYRINAFDWTAEFATIMKAGGFDAVIGNPPYGFHQIHDDSLKPYFKSHFAASSGSYEHYFLFYEASLKLLKKCGLHGFIVPVTWLTIPSAASLRRFILHNYWIRSIAWLPELVFKDAQVNTLVSIIERSPATITRILISDVNDPRKEEGTVREIPQSRFIEANNTILIFENADETTLLAKIDEASVVLSTIARPCSGYNPYEVGAGVAPNGKPHTPETVATRPYHSDKKLGPEWKPEAGGRDLGRYSLSWPQSRFVKYGTWLAAARDPNNFCGPRILVQEITGGPRQRIVATFCDQELFHSRDIIPIKCDTEWPHPLFLLGVINSWVITWRHHRRSPKAKKALFPKVLVGDLKQLPIPKCDKNNKDHSTKHDQIVQSVERMLAMHKSVANAKTDQDKVVLERQIAAVDRQIDKLVYGLYGLSDVEIAMVEDGVFQ